MVRRANAAEGTPLLPRSADRFLQKVRSLPPGHPLTAFKAWLVLFVIGRSEEIFASDAEPRTALGRVFERLDVLLDEVLGLGMLDVGPTLDRDMAGDGRSPVDARTGAYYGQLFAGFQQDAFWDEAAALLKTRLDRNGIVIKDLERTTVLDAGCGGGRYSVAWRRLGARRVVGVDISSPGIEDASARVKAASFDGVEFLRGSVLRIPLEDDSFDVVFSNGVLHHTEDWRRGIAELIRVLKPGGVGWLYLIEEPGGLFWELIDLLRAVMEGESSDAARRSLYGLGIAPNRVFYVLDHVMVPINVRLTPQEIETCLAEAGAVGIRRLTRGADRDRIERLFRNDPFAEMKFGVGENRYVFTKP